MRSSRKIKSIKSIDSYISKFSNQGKLIEKTDAEKVKGGRSKKDRIWNGCGGMIPQ